MAATEEQAGLRPTRARTKVLTDPDARHVVGLLSDLAARVDYAPAIRPLPGPDGIEGMVRLGQADRASYVWFLPCPPGGKSPAPVSGGGLCNHGIGIDRQNRSFEIRAWVHGAPKVHAVSIHTHEVTLELLEQVAAMVGIPLKPREETAKSWVHGTRLGREHRELGQHLIEDHGYDPAYVHGLSHGGRHGLHDSEHRDIWAYAHDLPHERCKGRVEWRDGELRTASWHIVGTRPGRCGPCKDHPSAVQEYSMSDPEGA